MTPQETENLVKQIIGSLIIENAMLRTKLEQLAPAQPVTNQAD